VVWAGSDLIVTGDPLYSLTYTSGFAEELGRAKGAGGVPAALWEFLVKLDKLPVLLGGILGVAIAVLAAPRRAAVPLVLLVVGIGTFGLVGAGGFSVIDRYLLVTSMVMMVFCAVALAGWTMLRPGRLRTGWMAGAALLVTAGIVLTAFQLNFKRLTNELRFRGDAHAALHDVLRDPAVVEGRRCVGRALQTSGSGPAGPVSVPNHKLVPEVRWMLDLPDGQVLARSQALRQRSVRRDVNGPGTAIYTVERAALLRQALVEDSDSPRTVQPLPGYVRTGVSSYYSAYVRC
jgi:hypothetical protein